MINCAILPTERAVSRIANIYFTSSANNDDKNYTSALAEFGILPRNYPAQNQKLIRLFFDIRKVKLGHRDIWL